VILSKLRSLFHPLVQVPKDGTTGPVVVSPRIPDEKYPQSLFFIDGPLIRLASNPAIGLSLSPNDKQVVPNNVSPLNILDQWRRADPLTNSTMPVIDLPMNASYLPVRREFQQCQYQPSTVPRRLLYHIQYSITIMMRRLYFKACSAFSLYLFSITPWL